MSQAALQYATSNSERFLEELKALIRIPSISGISDYHPDVRRAAEWLVNHLNTTVGFTNARVVEEVGLPLVYAERIIDPAKPTVLVYGHFDVHVVRSTTKARHWLSSKPSNH
ncbi:MAG: hypothetical protein LW717_20990 [Chloroflexaceae bacterium]|nr:hypothetical protein [Chloroflexaceae bacterium]